MKGYKLVYNLNDGSILQIVDNIQSEDSIYYNNSNIDKKSIGILHIDQIPMDLRYYKVLNEDLVKYLDCEVLEIKLYGKVLTEEERILKQLEPSQEEIRNAEETLKLLELLQEVM